MDSVEVFRTRSAGVPGFCQQGEHQTGIPRAFEQSIARDLRILRGLDQLDHLVDVRERDRETFEDVGTGARLAQLEDRAPRDHLAAMAHEGFEHVLEVEQARTAIDQRDHVDAEHRLHLGLLVEVVQHNLGRLAALELDVDAHAVLVGLVAQTVGRNTFDLLVLVQLGDRLDQPRLVHLVRQLGDDDRFATVRLIHFDLGARTHQHAAAARVIRRMDASRAVDDARGREVRTGDDAASGASTADVRIVDDRDRTRR